MKLTFLFSLAVMLLSQSGCATRPSIDEQSREIERNEQAAKQSDAFARSLPP